MKDDHRNKSRAPGMTLLGVPMHKDLKSRIKSAADLDRRTMADWARIQLEKAADAVISNHHQSNHAPISMVAEDPAPYRIKKQGKS